jgi:hypothetical protein
MNRLNQEPPAHEAEEWSSTYVVTAVIALYLNVFVWLSSSLLRYLALRALAPTQSEGPFKFTQLLVLVLFVLPSIFAVRGSHEKQVRTT